MDDDGHGTHTSSTIARAFVKHASVSGIARGVAIGMALHAHIAVYNVCSVLCHGDDVFAAIDVAVEDGVDVLSLSLGEGEPFHYMKIQLLLVACTLSKKESSLVAQQAIRGQNLALWSMMHHGCSQWLQAQWIGPFHPL